jgi:hypothetical protein
MESQPRQKSVLELLNEIEEPENEHVCQNCGYVQEELFTICPNCKKRANNPTLGEWGKQLPIGIEQEDGTFLRSFDMKPLDWPKEREINRHWGASRGNLTLSNYIGTILACTVTSIGNQDITKFKIPKRLLIFNSMYQGDVFYMYAYLRILSLGNEMKLGQIRCSMCGHQFPYTADLSTLETVVINKPEDLLHQITLKDGFEMGGDHKTKLVVKPPLWNMMGDSLPKNLNSADMFLSMLTHSVVSIEGLPDGAILTEKELSQFTKMDIEICEDVLEDVLAGPRWEIEGTCPKCDETFYDLVDWTYDNFFAISSRSSRRRRRSRRL